MVSFCMLIIATMLHAKTYQVIKGIIVSGNVLRISCLNDNNIFFFHSFRYFFMHVIFCICKFSHPLSQTAHQFRDFFTAKEKNYYK